MTGSLEGVPRRGLPQLVLLGAGAGALIAVMLLVFYLMARPSAPVLLPGVASSAEPAALTTLSSVTTPSPSSWRALNAEEQRALAPLSAEWDSLDATRQRKWRVIADRFPHMSADEQARTQERMREWVRLTPDQRRIARDSYLRAHDLAPEKRAELLQKYQELPAEEKAHLAALAREHHSVLPTRPRVHDEPVPSKAQIREGSTQRVPGLYATQKNGVTTPLAPNTSAAALPVPAGVAPAAAAPAGALQSVPAAAAGSPTPAADSGAASPPAPATAPPPAPPAPAAPPVAPAAAPAKP